MLLFKAQPAAGTGFTGEVQGCTPVRCSVARRTGETPMAKVLNARIDHRPGHAPQLQGG